jgi:hypothetical protein
MQTITLNPDEKIHVVIEGKTMCVEHITDAEGGHALQLGGVDCDLDGEMPGTYYPAPLRALDEIKPGARGVLTAPHDFGHISVYVPEGSTGVFTYIDEHTVNFRLDEPVPNLHDSEWENEIVFAAEDADCWTDGASTDPRLAALYRVRVTAEAVA